MGFGYPKPQALYENRSMKLLAALIGLFFISATNAGTLSFTDQTITKVYAGYSHKGAFFQVSTGDSRNPANCTAGLNKIFTLDPIFSDVSHTLSILLFAQASGKHVEVEFYEDKCFESHRVARKVAVY